MKTRWLLCALVAAGSIGFFAGTGFSEDPPAGPPSDEQMMKMMEEYARPGPAQEAMKAFAGDWDVASKAWMKPGEDPMTSSGTSSSHMTFGGRYLRMTYSGDFMGKKFEGAGVMGFDNHLKQYQSVWYDTMSSGMMWSTGKTLDDGTIEINGVWDGPMGKMDSRMQYKVVDKDTYVLTGWMKMEGMPGEMKHMELTFTRKKARASTRARSGWRMSKGPGY